MRIYLVVSVGLEYSDNLRAFSDPDKAQAFLDSIQSQCNDGEYLTIETFYVE